MKNSNNIKNCVSRVWPIVGNQWGVLSLFLVVSLGMNLLCSCFSPMFSLVLSTDSSCFYMQGHAWANGLVPYVDFIDVKGPLLFFLFKIASILTPDSTVGAYLLYSFADATCLYFSYRTGLLLLEDGKKAFVSAMALLPVIYWWQTYLSGGESEELMMPFFSLLLYTWLRYMRKPERPSSLKSLSFSVGVGAGVTLLIKYNCTFVFAVAFVLLSLLLISNGKWRAVLMQVLPCVFMGFFIVVAPFMLYLYTSGTLQPCWDVYVTLNFSTYFGAHTQLYSMGKGLTKFISYAEMIFRCREGLWASLSIIVASFYPFFLPKEKKRCAMLLVILGAAFFSCMGRYHDYYMLFCAPSFIIPILFVMQHLKFKVGNAAVLIIAIGCMYVAVRENGQWAERAPMRVTQKLSGSVAEAENAVCRIRNPRILYLGALDRGFGVSVGALPACPEWCTLNGVDNAFKERQKMAVEQRKADFIIVLSEWYGAQPKSPIAGKVEYQTPYDALCQANGYARVCSFSDGKRPTGLYTLYSKKKIAD